MLIVPQRIIDDIGEHAKETYPEECCGILVGRKEDDNRIITESHRSDNVAEKRRRERYSIDTKKELEVGKAIRGRGLSVIGYYHSHPDSPSRPSPFDKKIAWPRISYLIATVRKNGNVSMQSWMMPDEDEDFVEDEMKIEETV